MELGSCSWLRKTIQLLVIIIAPRMVNFLVTGDWTRWSVWSLPTLWFCNLQTTKICFLKENRWFGGCILWDYTLLRSLLSSNPVFSRLLSQNLRVFPNPELASLIAPDLQNLSGLDASPQRQPVAQIFALWISLLLLWHVLCLIQFFCSLRTTRTHDRWPWGGNYLCSLDRVVNCITRREESDIISRKTSSKIELKM